MFTREKLQEIREEASVKREQAVNTLWVDAYADLVNAADRLDAMTARCTVLESQAESL
jgi:hypothetical protein